MNKNARMSNNEADNVYFRLFSQGYSPEKVCSFYKDKPWSAPYIRKSFLRWQQKLSSLPPHIKHLYGALAAWQVRADELWTQYLNHQEAMEKTKMLYNRTCDGIDAIKTEINSSLLKKAE